MDKSEGSRPQATGTCGDVVNLRAKGGLKDVYTTH